jgi:glycosyltransferase involved in cell wall biosynthesis
MTSGNPRVSVITAFLNGEAFLAEAIESVIAQSFPDWELLLINDGSGPEATEIAKSYAARFPGRIFYFEHTGHINRGATVSRNVGVQNARGDFIAILDADDVWLPSKLADHVAVLDANPKVGMVAGTAIYWNSWSSGQDTAVPSGHRQDVVINPPDASLALYPLGAAETPCPSDFVLRADLVKQIGGFEEQFIGEKLLYEDQAFLAKLFLVAPVYFCGAPSIKYRIHPKSCVSRAATNMVKYQEIRLYFLEWFEGYLKTTGYHDPRVASGLQRVLRHYRRPRIDYLLSLPRKVRSWVCRILSLS